MRPIYSIHFKPFSDFVTVQHEAPVVRATFGGHNYWFLFDTGSPASLLKYSAFQDTKQTFVKVPQIPSGSNMAGRMLINGKNRGAVVPTFQLGKALLPRVPFYVVPDEVLNIIIGEDRSFAGILGEDFLGKFAMYIDFEHREIRLIPHGRVTSKELALLGFHHPATTPILLQETRDMNRKLWVQATCNGKNISLFIDTAGSYSSIY